MSDIINNKETGFILNPNDEKQWAEHILRLVKKPQESQKMGENGNEMLKTKYNQELFYEGILKMYQDVLKSTSP